LKQGFSLTANFELVTKPNSSLTAECKVLVFAAIGLVSLVIALFFVFMGAWLVLPFAGLELLALGYAFYYMHCHSRDYERIVIVDDQVSIETRSYKTFNQTNFNRYWVKVFLRSMPNGDQQLFFRSHGKEVMFGQCFMTSQERVELASQLKQQVGLIY
jgi:uncharacterized membrane protein